MLSISLICRLRPGLPCTRFSLRDRTICRYVLASLFVVAGSSTALPRIVCAASIAPEILAFYYGWYGNPQVSGEWRHWKNVDPVNKRIENVTDFPAYGIYDSHDTAVVDRQAEAARSAGITGFIASWWGYDSFEDRGMPLLLASAGKHKLSVSAYYEKIAGDDAASRIKAAVGDIPGGVVLIADSLDREFVSTFDGASTYNITGQTQHKSPPEIQAWAHATYPKMVAAAGSGKIATVTIIPGYDDRNLWRLPPRPVTDRWGGETYRALWHEAIAAAPDYVLITSWNEWHEGSELEASVEYGSRILDNTAAFSREFLARER